MHQPLRPRDLSGSPVHRPRCVGRGLVAALVVGLVAACGGAAPPGDGASTEPARSELPSAPASPRASSFAPTVDADCVAIADELIVALQAAVDEAGGASLDDVLNGDALAPKTRARLEELEARATAADCSEPQLAALLRLRADRIQGDQVLARLLRNALRAGHELPL